MSIFKRYLTLWVALCIVAGVALGHVMPGFFGVVVGAEVAKVNLPVAVLIWLMIVPMLLKIDFGSLGQVREHWRGVGVTLFINWAVKPFSMALLASIFIGHLFAPMLPSARSLLHRGPDSAGCRALHGDGVRLVQPLRGRTAYTLSQVALNDLSWSSFRAAGRPAARCGVDHRPLGHAASLRVLYIVVPVVVAQLWRAALLRAGAFERTMRMLQPISLVALLATLVLLFGFQGDQIIRQPMVIAILAVPILIQVYFNAGLAYWLSRRFGVAWCVAAPAALIGASNFFELAVAAAISLFGLDSGAALATVVGVLVEVPVMLSVVHIVKATRGWYEAGCDPASVAPEVNR